MKRPTGCFPGCSRPALLEVIGERAVPTREGFLVADRLPCCSFDSFQDRSREVELGRQT